MPLNYLHFKYFFCKFFKFKLRLIIKEVMNNYFYDIFMDFFLLIIST